MEGRGQAACAVGTGLAGTGGKPLAEESRFHSYLSPPSSAGAVQPLGFSVRADEPLTSETGQRV